LLAVGKTCASWAVSPNECGNSRLMSAITPTEVSPSARPPSQRRALARGAATTARAKTARKRKTRSNSLNDFSRLAAQSAERPVQSANAPRRDPETSAAGGTRAAGQRPAAEARTIAHKTTTATEFRLVSPYVPSSQASQKTPAASRGAHR
jgi:hypothetical protein